MRGSAPGIPRRRACPGRLVRRRLPRDGGGFQVVEKCARPGTGRSVGRARRRCGAQRLAAVVSDSSPSSVRSAVAPADAQCVLKTRRNRGCWRAAG